MGRGDTGAAVRTDRSAGDGTEPGEPGRESGGVLEGAVRVHVARGGRAHRARDVPGDRAWVMSRDEAIKEGWFGLVDAAMTSRIGDVVAAPAGSLAIVATKAEPRESALTGMHGSLTPSEQLVPALMYTAA